MEHYFNNEELFVWEQNASPLLLALTLPGIKDLKKWFNLGHFTTIVVFNKTTQAKWLFRRDECNLIGCKIVDALKFPLYRAKFEDAIKESEKILLKKISKIENYDILSNCTLDDAIKLFRELENCFYNYFKYTVLVEPIEWYTEHKLTKYVDTLSISDGEKKHILQFLLKIDDDSFSSKIMLSLNECAITLDNFLRESTIHFNKKDNIYEISKQIIDCNSTNETYKKLMKQLNEHSNLYYWKKNNYFSTKKLMPRDILEELLERVLDEKNTINTYKKNILDMQENKQKELNEKKKYLDQLPENLKVIVEINNKFGGKLGDDRKATIMKTNSAFEKIIKVVEKYTNVSSQDIHLLIPQEIEDFAKNYKHYKEHFERRKKGFIIYQSDFPLLEEIVLDSFEDEENVLDWKLELMEDPFIAEAEQAEEVLSRLNTYYNLYTENTVNTHNLKGTVIYSDIPKISGKVRIIRNPKTEVIQKDEILIATSTTPDFINSICNSKAVITDWGGLTSHAAIITRELKNPCIIGTNYATQVLKDGDEIEIDLKNGIITMLDMEVD